MMIQVTTLKGLQPCFHLKRKNILNRWRKKPGRLHVSDLEILSSFTPRCMFRIFASIAVHTAPPLQPETQAQDIFTVNIPNTRGGYTPVALKRSGSGFIGPQGEYYTEFPKVEQLKVMYGK